jgi:hypothetical protein
MTMRARDHKTLEALRIGAVRSVEVDESPSVARALGVTVRTMHGGDQQRRFREEGSPLDA